MDGPPNLKRVTCSDVITPLSRRFVIRMLRLATINLCTKYEVSMFSHYEDMKGDEKKQKLGWLGGLEVPQSHRQHNHSIEHI